MRIRPILAASALAVAGLTVLPQQATGDVTMPITPLQCLSRSATQITAPNGELTGTQGSTSSQVDRTWDLRDFSHTTSPNPTRYPFRLDAAKRACIIGGSVIGNIPRDFSREQFYDVNTNGIEWDNEGYRPTHTADSPWIYQYGSYVENVSDAFDPNGLANGVNHTYLDHVHAKDIRDDCVEVEGEGYSPHTITITRSLFDGCHTFLSMRPTGTSHADAGTSEGTLTIDDSLAYVKPNELGASNCSQTCSTIGGVPYMGNHVLFKWSTEAVKNVVVRNTVFRVDQPSAFSTRGMHWPDGVYDNVTLVWTWPKPYTDYFTVPDGVRVTGDVKVWDDAKAAWLAGGPIVPPPTPVPANVAPTTSAGPDRTVVLPAAVNLSGVVSDDGLPRVPGLTTASWTKVSGLGAVAFSNPAAASTTATFSTAGSYVLRLTATDGLLTSTDDVTVSATTASTVTSLDLRVGASEDDAEENLGNGSQSLTSSDLEVGYDRGKRQQIGMRFTNVAIPSGAKITKAYVQFTTRAAGSNTTAGTIRGQAADAADGFNTTSKDISSRPGTTAAVSWSPVAWPTVNVAGTAQRTPDLATVLQEIVNRGGWASGSSLALLIEGLSGTRNGWSYDGSSSKAPLLHVEYAL